MDSSLWELFHLEAEEKEGVCMRSRVWREPETKGECQARGDSSWVRLANTVAHCEEVRGVTAERRCSWGCRLYGGPWHHVLWVTTMSVKAEWKKTGIRM